MTIPIQHSEPDPSHLTTQAILREVQILDDKIEDKVEQRNRADAALEKLLVARIEAIEKTDELHLQWSGTIPDQIRLQVSHLEVLHQQRFEGIALQFKERDIRTEQAAVAGGAALAAALQAAKELVGAQGEASAAAAVKSETSFTKQIDQIGALVESKDKATDARITELKERIDRGEGADVGVRENRSVRRADSGNVVGIIGGVVGVAGLLLLAMNSLPVG